MQQVNYNINIDIKVKEAEVKVSMFITKHNKALRTSDHLISLLKSINPECPLNSLIELKHDIYAGSIHSISADKLFIHFWSPSQFVYKHVRKSNCRLSLDAPGSLIKKLKMTKYIIKFYIFVRSNCQYNKSSSSGNCKWYAKNMILLQYFNNIILCYFGLIRFVNCVLADYRLTGDGVQVRKPHRRVWQEHQRRLDLASRLLDENRYSVLELFTCVKHVTPTFGTIRPTENQHPIVIRANPPIDIRHDRLVALASPPPIIVQLSQQPMVHTMSPPVYKILNQSIHSFFIHLLHSHHQMQSSQHQLSFSNHQQLQLLYSHHQLSSSHHHQ